MLGHTQANNTYRYVNPNVETARRAAAILDELNRTPKTASARDKNRRVSQYKVRVNSKTC